MIEPHVAAIADASRPPAADQVDPAQDRADCFALTRAALALHEAVPALSRHAPFLVPIAAGVAQMLALTVEAQPSPDRDDAREEYGDHANAFITGGSIRTADGEEQKL